MTRSLAAFGGALALFLLTRPASADSNAPIVTGGAFSTYELETIHGAEQQLGAMLDVHPDGKVIEAIDYYTLDVFEPRVPVPLLVNAFHATTRSYVLEREMLFKVGESYEPVIVEETARNLRQLPQLSLALIVPLRGSQPGRVRVAVLTKDVWSLRLSWDVLVTPGGLERLTIAPGEWNLFGSHQSAQGRFSYLPLSYSLGGSYTVPRLFGSRIALGTELGIIMNSTRGQPEGSYGTLTVKKPLYSTRTEWAWGAEGSWVVEVTRRYINAQLAAFTQPPIPGAIPFLWNTNVITGEAWVTRSFGWRVKDEVSFGFEYARRVYNTGDMAAYDPLLTAAFVEERVPRSDTRSGPFLQYRAYTTNFVRLLDQETLGLQEDFRIGHDFFVKVQPVAQAFGGSRNFLGTYAGAQYTFPIDTGLIRLSAEAAADLTLENVPDAAVSGAIRIVSPRTDWGRLVFDARILDRFRNYLNRQTFLGGDTRLRGYPSSYFVGQNFAASNLEFRSRAINVFSVQIGGALFYDSGGVWDNPDDKDIHQSVGVGFRALIPQLNRVVLRGDLGFPIPQGGKLPPGVAPAAFFFTFGQAFSMPVVGS